jgi:hypothetical protein
MMWHFVEEIEHRSSGLILCEHINPDPWYRVKHIRATFSHVGKLSDAIAKTFDEVVPQEDRGASAQELMSTCCSTSSSTAHPVVGVDALGGTVRRRCSMRCRRVSWSRWCGG